MRALFIVTAKLLGLFQLVNAALAASQIIAYIPYLTIDSLGGYPASEPAEFGFMMFVMAAYYLLLAGLAALLIFKTERIADMLRIPQDDGALLALPAKTLLTVGTQLIGLYLVATNLPAAAVLLVEGIPSGALSPFFGGPNDFTTRALSVAGGILLLWRAGFIVRFLQRACPTDEAEKPAPLPD